MYKASLQGQGAVGRMDVPGPGWDSCAGPCSHWSAHSRSLRPLQGPETGTAAPHFSNGEPEAPRHTITRARVTDLVGVRPGFTPGQGCLRHAGVARSHTAGQGAPDTGAGQKLEMLGRACERKSSLHSRPADEHSVRAAGPLCIFLASSPQDSGDLSLESPI